MRNSNPVFNSNLYDAAQSSSSHAMTFQGTVNKTGFLFILLFFAASITWRYSFEAPGTAKELMMVGFGGSLIFSLLTIFMKQNARFFAPIYAVFEGLLLGAISAAYAMLYNGIVFHALLLTFGTLGCMLFAYKTGLIKVTARFQAGIITATAGIFFAYLGSMLLGMFGFASPFASTGPMGIVISLVIVGVAALNLLLDFERVNQGVQNGAPEYLEWYSAFGIMVTIVWLYLEILRLLSKLRSRD